MSKDFFPKHARRHRKTLFFRATFSCIFSQFFLLFTPKCDTCDSKKTTLWSECAHLCAPMRTYAHLCAPMRAREKRSLKIFSPRFSSFSLLPHFLFFLLLLCLFPHSPSLSPSSLLGHSILASLCFAMCVLQICCFAKKKMHISLIFSRFGAISTHIQIGGCVVNPHLFRN